MADCTCSNCLRACTHKPGWFAPGEIEKAAALRGMSTRDFFLRHCSADYWTRNIEGLRPVWVISPAVISADPGKEFPANPRGKCSLLVDGLCSIHAAKPHECRETMHTDSRERTDELHKSVRDMWDKPEHQKQITDLIGREPQLPEPWDMFGAMFDLLLPSDEDLDEEAT